MRRWSTAAGLPVVLGVITLGALALVLAACGPTDPEVAPAGTPDDARGAVDGAGAGPSGVPRPSVDVLAFEPVPVKGGRLVVGQGEEPATLYLYGRPMLAGAHVLNAIYDGPIEGLDHDYQPVILERLPRLEEAGTGATLDLVTVQPGEPYFDVATQQVVSATVPVPDLPRLTLRFTIREGVAWEDGTPVTADDSVFARQIACDPATDAPKVVCERTAHYTQIDDRTVEWQGLPGYTDQAYVTFFYAPLPRHQVSAATGEAMVGMSAEEIAADATFARKPLAYGPFRILEWTAGDRITLAPNEHYWRRDAGLPVLDALEYRFIPSPADLLTALLEGEIDVATHDGLDITQYDALEQAAADASIVPHYVVGTAWEHIDFNLNPADDRPVFGACQAIRKALMLGTDRPAMVAEILRGEGQVQNTYVLEGHWAYPDPANLVTYAYDPERARQMLEEVGFADGDGDGFLEAQKDVVCTANAPDGQPRARTIPAGTVLELTLNTSARHALREQTSLLFQRNMRQIGVKVALGYLDDAVLFEPAETGPINGRRYDLAEFAWVAGVQPAASLFTCGLIPSDANQWLGENNSGWCDPEYDRLAARAEQAVDRDEAAALFAEAQQRFTEALPVIPLFARVKVMATRPTVVNFRPNVSGASETWNVESWGFAR